MVVVVVVVVEVVVAVVVVVVAVAVAVTVAAAVAVAAAAAVAVAVAVAAAKAKAIHTPSFEHGRTRTWTPHPVIKSGSSRRWASGYCSRGLCLADVGKQPEKSKACPVDSNLEKCVRGKYGVCHHVQGYVPQVPAMAAKEEEEVRGSEGYVLNRAEHLLKHLGQQESHGDAGFCLLVATFRCLMDGESGSNQGETETLGSQRHGMCFSWHFFQQFGRAQPAASVCCFRQDARRRSEFQDPKPARPGPGTLILP